MSFAWCMLANNGPVFASLKNKQTKNIRPDPLLVDSCFHQHCLYLMEKSQQPPTRAKKGFHDKEQNKAWPAEWCVLAGQWAQAQHTCLRGSTEEGGQLWHELVGAGSYTTESWCKYGSMNPGEGRVVAACFSCTLRVGVVLGPGRGGISMFHRVSWGTSKCCAPVWSLCICLLWCYHWEQEWVWNMPLKHHLLYFSSIMGWSWSTQIPFVSEGTKQEDAAQHTSCASSGNRHLLHSIDLILLWGKAYKTCTAWSLGPQHQLFHSASPLLLLHTTHWHRQRPSLPKCPGELWQYAVKCPSLAFLHEKVCSFQLFRTYGGDKPSNRRVSVHFLKPFGFYWFLFFFISQIYARSIWDYKVKVMGT